MPGPATVKQMLLTFGNDVGLPLLAGRDLSEIDEDSECHRDFMPDWDPAEITVTTAGRSLPPMFASASNAMENVNNPVPDPDPVLEDLKERGWREVAEIDRALVEGRIDENGWHDAMSELIKPAYLSADNPYAQAGHSGDEKTWESSRGFIAEALHRSGTFLDGGCANGILMESTQRWGARKNLRIEPYGIDIVPELVQLAQHRLPHWADRISVGNIRTWQPINGRFDFALIRPEYAPAGRRAGLVRHLIEHVLTPGGRLIVLVGTEEREFRRVELTVVSEFPVHGRVEIPHSIDERLVRRLFWINSPST